MSRDRWVVILAALLLLFMVRPSAARQDTPTPTAAYLQYTVQSGDTLGLIASRYHVTISDIMRLNHIANPQLIVIGQNLRIPSSSTTASASPTLLATMLFPTVTQSAPIPPSTLEVTTEITAQAETVSPAFDYGVEAFFDNQNLSSVISQISTLGMHWVKLRVEWRDLEATKRSIDYTKLDPIIDGLKAQNFSVLLTVTAAPDWARTDHEEKGPPDNYADYATFIGALAAHYAGKVQAYEIWNEPNLRREWNSTIHPLGAQNYADLLRAAYSAVKSADSAAVVVSAGLAPTGFNDGVNALDDQLYLQALYDQGLAQISDAIGAHPYGFANPPDAVCCNAPAGVKTHYGHPSFYFLDTLNDYHAIMQKNGDSSKLIWATQFGWGTSADLETPPRNSIYVSYTSLEQQAKYLPSAFEIGARLGFVGVMIAYNLNSCIAQPDNTEACYYSLIGPSGQPRPSYNALALIFATAAQR